eukprot:CAMPEP_0184546074 /NCGR_PEP_ID=MMETSP0199_2-20130426/4722_1 /TAXON_ID=1112570 /ORGANISM="Thraustochytrium sp., Strain LLF1b" /LENGTH=580 /DNA_ID=CAMNT_0026940439 /DNA_START=116 /DNA_END=1858 /DNA_ORIENTATION=-
MTSQARISERQQQPLGVAPLPLKRSRSRSWAGWDDSCPVLDSWSQMKAKSSSDEFCLEGKCLPPYLRMPLQEVEVEQLLKRVSTKIMKRLASRPRAGRAGITMMLKMLGTKTGSCVLAVRSAFEDCEGGSESDLEEAIRLVTEAHGDVQFLHVDTDVVLVSYFETQAARDLVSVLDSSKATLVSPGFGFQGPRPQSLVCQDILCVTLHCETSATTEGQVYAALGCTQAQVACFLGIVRSGSNVEVKFKDVRDASAAFHFANNRENVLSTIQFKPMSKREQRRIKALYQFLGCSPQRLLRKLTHTEVRFFSPPSEDGPSTDSNCCTKSLVQRGLSESGQQYHTHKLITSTRNKSGKGSAAPAKGAKAQSNAKRQRSFTSEGSSKSDSNQPDYQIHLEDIWSGKDQRKAIMIRNIPNKYTQSMILQEIDEWFAGTYDFFYLPIDFEQMRNFGYAFINFIDPSAVIHFFNIFEQRRWNNFNSDKICSIRYARVQNRGLLIRRLVKSNVMQMQADCQPLILNRSRQVHPAQIVEGGMQYFYPPPPPPPPQQNPHLHYQFIQFHDLPTAQHIIAPQVNPNPYCSQ